MSHTIKLILLLLAFCLPDGVSAQTIKGIVTHVKDGDSFVVKSAGKTTEVRLDGIDCPEKGQPFSAKARQYTSSLVSNQTIVIDIRGYDKYKRALAVVYINGNRVLNEELLKAGMAWHFKKYNREKRLARLEIGARKSRIGLWDDPEPIPPWEYRQMQRQGKQLNPK